MQTPSTVTSSKNILFLDTPSIINGLRLNKTPHQHPDTLIDAISEKVNIFYKNENQWQPLTSYQENPSSHPVFQEINFELISVEASKFINKEPDDLNYYI